MAWVGQQIGFDQESAVSPVNHFMPSARKGDPLSKFALRKMRSCGPHKRDSRW